MTAPALRSRSFSSGTGNERTSPFAGSAIAAAIPAACPVMKQPGMTRMELSMRLSVLTQRPAVNRFLKFFTVSIR